MGALKDTTTVSIAKVNSDYKVLMIASLKFKALFQDLSLLHESCIRSYELFFPCYSVLVTGAGHCYCEGHKPCRESNKGEIRER
jgi:hypothetical protein